MVPLPVIEEAGLPKLIVASVNPPVGSDGDGAGVVEVVQDGGVLAASDMDRGAVGGDAVEG